jgi:hypothetical protein
MAARALKPEDYSVVPGSLVTAVISASPWACARGDENGYSGIGLTLN